MRVWGLACLLVLIAIAALAEDGRPDISLMQDWSQHHVVYTNMPTRVEAAVAATRDPRALSSFLRRVVAARNARERRARRTEPFEVDWAFSMGVPNTTTPMAAYQYPAIFTQNFTSPSCTADFLVMPVNIAGSATAANLIGVNRLYSNAARTGLCNTVSGPSVLFAYFNAGANATSVSMSRDGTKIIWVENSTPAKLHVLAWRAEGTVAAPVAPPAAANAPVAGSGTVATVTLSGNVTRSSAFVDYDHDVAYVGDNSGNLYRIKDVFCTTLSCQSTPVAPSLDTTAWAPNGFFNLAATSLTAPVTDGVTGNIYVGGANGTLYVRKGSDGTSVGTVAVGNANQGGINDPPIVDGTGANGNELVYVFAGDDTGVAGGLSAAVAVQIQVSLSTGAIGTVTRQNIGAANIQPVRMGALNDAYYTGTGTARLYACGTSPFASRRRLYRIPFGAGSVIGAPASLGNVGTNTNQVCSPLTAFNNGTNDRLFLTLGTNRVLDDYVITADLTSATCPNAPTCLQQSTGTAGTVLTSGLIIDNGVTGTAQAANIYFGKSASGNITNGSCWTGTNLALSGTSTKTNGVGTYTTGANHGLAIGETVAIVGNTNANVNGNCTVTATPTATTFTCTYTTINSGSGTGGNVQLGTCAFKLTQNALN
jgi:hypothetical protein